MSLTNFWSAKQIVMPSGGVDAVTGASPSVSHLSSGELSALKIAGAVQRTRDNISNLVSSGKQVGNAAVDFVADHLSNKSVASTGGGTAAFLPDYINADLAKAYGMDASTAYQEALSNTSFQRAVKDLQAAGLNPVLAAGQVSPAAGVYSARLNGSGVDISSGVSSAHSAYKFMSAAGGIVGTIIGALNGGPKGAYFGSRVGTTAGSALGNLIDLL